MSEDVVGEVLLYATAPNRGAALAIVRSLLEDRLIACANVIDGATSLYRWEGKIEEAGESLIFAKSTSRQVSDIVDRIKELHEYSCPCVIAMPIVAGNADFLQWIGAETKR